MKLVQATWMTHVWRSPDGDYEHSFAKLNPECEPDNRAGIVILADESLRNAFAVVVDDLRNELPALIDGTERQNVIYWWLEEDMADREEIFQGITDRPVYIG